MKILLAVDGSRSSEVAVNRVARRPWPEGSKIKVISVAEAHLPFTPEVGLLPAQFYDELERAASSHAESIVAGAVEKLREHAGPQIRIIGETMSGSPNEAIVREAESWGAELIVIGSHGHRGSKRGLLGPVAQAVALQAKCSVEIVRAPHLDGIND
ncbi:MAG TPA: universal stress protein [Blastocatellia bacterium]|nr:universal stress protein [Blastocatellia bacterium]